MSQFPPLYLTISRTVTAPIRLAALRKACAGNWRRARAWTLQNGAAAFGALSQGFILKNAGTKYEKRDAMWYCHTGAEFKRERFADECDGGPDHTGWFADADCSRTVRGIVARLPHGFYVAGYHESDNDARTYLAKVYDCERTAARAADQEAERYAEEAKEYDERYQFAQAMDEQIADKGRQVARMFKLRHTEGFDDAASYRELEDGISELRAMKVQRAEYNDVEM